MSPATVYIVKGEGVRDSSWSPQRAAPPLSYTNPPLEQLDAGATLQSVVIPVIRIFEKDTNSVPPFLPTAQQQRATPDPAPPQQASAGPGTSVSVVQAAPIVSAPAASGGTSAATSRMAKETSPTNASTTASASAPALPTPPPDQPVLRRGRRFHHSANMIAHPNSQRFAPSRPMTEQPAPPRATAQAAQATRSRSGQPSVPRTSEQLVTTPAQTTLARTPALPIPKPADATAAASSGAASLFGRWKAPGKPVSAAATSPSAQVPSPRLPSPRSPKAKNTPDGKVRSKAWDKVKTATAKLASPEVQREAMQNIVARTKVTQKKGGRSMPPLMPLTSPVTAGGSSGSTGGGVSARDGKKKEVNAERGLNDDAGANVKVSTVASAATGVAAGARTTARENTGVILGQGAGTTAAAPKPAPPLPRESRDPDVMEVDTPAPQVEKEVPPQRKLLLRKEGGVPDTVGVASGSAESERAAASNVAALHANVRRLSDSAGQRDKESRERTGQKRRASQQLEGSEDAMGTLARPIFSEADRKLAMQQKAAQASLRAAKQQASGVSKSDKRQRSATADTGVDSSKANGTSAGATRTPSETDRQGQQRRTAGDVRVEKAASHMQENITKLLYLIMEKERITSKEEAQKKLKPLAMKLIQINLDGKASNEEMAAVFSNSSAKGTTPTLAVHSTRNQPVRQDNVAAQKGPVEPTSPRLDKMPRSPTLPRSETTSRQTTRPPEKNGTNKLVRAKSHDKLRRVDVDDIKGLHFMFLQWKTALLAGERSKTQVVSNSNRLIVVKAALESDDPDTISFREEDLFTRLGELNDAAFTIVVLYNELNSVVRTIADGQKRAHVTIAESEFRALVKPLQDICGWTFYLISRLASAWRKHESRGTLHEIAPKIMAFVSSTEAVFKDKTTINEGIIRTLRSLRSNLQSHEGHEKLPLGEERRKFSEELKRHLRNLGAVCKFAKQCLSEPSPSAVPTPPSGRSQGAVGNGPALSGEAESRSRGKDSGATQNGEVKQKASGSASAAQPTVPTRMLATAPATGPLKASHTAANGVFAPTATLSEAARDLPTIPRRSTDARLPAGSPKPSAQRSETNSANAAARRNQRRGVTDKAPDIRRLMQNVANREREGSGASTTATKRKPGESILRNPGQPGPQGPAKRQRMRTISFVPDYVTGERPPRISKAEVQSLFYDGYDLLGCHNDLQSQAVEDRSSQLDRASVIALYGYLRAFIGSLQNEISGASRSEPEWVVQPYTPAGLRQIWRLLEKKSDNPPPRYSPPSRRREDEDPKGGAGAVR